MAVAAVPQTGQRLSKNQPVRIEENNHLCPLCILQASTASRPEQLLRRSHAHTEGAPVKRVLRRVLAPDRGQGAIQPRQVRPAREQRLGDVDQRVRFILASVFSLRSMRF